MSWGGEVAGARGRGREGSLRCSRMALAVEERRTTATTRRGPAQTFAPRSELASALLRLIRAMRGVITGRDVMQNVGIIYREFGVRCLARCLWVLALGKRTTFLEVVTAF